MEERKEDRKKVLIIIFAATLIIFIFFALLTTWLANYSKRNQEQNRQDQETRQNQNDGENNSNNKPDTAEDDQADDSNDEGNEPEDEAPTLKYETLKFVNLDALTETTFSYEFEVPIYADQDIKVISVAEKKMVEINGVGFALKLDPAMEASSISDEYAATAAKIEVNRLYPGKQFFRFKRINFSEDTSKDYYTYSDFYVETKEPCISTAPDKFCFGSAMAFAPDGNVNLGGGLNVLCTVEKNKNAYLMCDKVLKDLRVFGELVGGN